MLIDKDVEESK